MRTTTLPSGENVPVLGQGTWGMGERPAARRGEIDALQASLDLGMSLIDIAVLDKAFHAPARKSPLETL